MKNVVAGLIIDRDSILIARRKQGKSHGGQWEFPGGKLENGESPQEGLSREIHEELGVDAEVGEVFAEAVYDYPAGSINLIAVFAKIHGTEFTLIDHDQVTFVPIATLLDYDLAPADIPIAKKLIGRENDRDIS